MPAGVELATAYVSLTVAGDKVAPGVKRALGSASGEADRAGKAAGGRFGATFSKAMASPIGKLGGLVAGAFAADQVVDFFKGAIDEARESQKVSAQTASVIKATGGAAGVSAGQIGKLAGVISDYAGIDDEVIQGGANMLLTFKNIRNEAGKGNDVFNQATRTLTDMSVAMGVEPQKAAIQLGKALNDPVKGISALSRVGVQFDTQQTKMIEHLVKTGDTMKAQKVILHELNSEFGGSAKAQATAGDKMETAWGNLKEQVGTALLPTLDDLEGTVTNKIIPAVSNFLDEMQTGKGAGGEFVDTVEKLAGASVDTAKAIGHTVGPLAEELLPGLEAGAKFAGILVHGVDDLPAPLKSLAVSAAIAAVAWKKLVNPAAVAVTNAWGATAAGSIRNVRTELSMMSTNRAWQQSMNRLSAAGIVTTTNLGTTSRTVSSLRTGLTKIQPAAQMAAGAGGMMLLVDGMKRASDEGGTLSTTLETTLGGALTGLAMGGIPGLLAGGAAGGLAALSKGFGKAKNEATKLAYAATLGKWQERAKGANESYKDSLDDITGAATKATKAATLQELQSSGQLKFARQAGISNRRLVDLTLNQGAAQKQVNKWTNEYNKLRKTDLTNLTPREFKAVTNRMHQLDNLIDLVTRTTGANRRSRAEVQKEAIDLGHLRKVLGMNIEQYKKVPRSIKSHFEQVGIPQSISGIRKLIKNYGATPELIKTLARLDGYDPSSRAIRALIKLAQDLDGRKPTVTAIAQTRAAIDQMAAVEAKLRGLDGDVATTYIRTVHTESRADNGGKSPGSNASGTPYWPGGWTWVGENGPELINLQRGAAVYSNQRSMQMIGHNAAGTGSPVPVALGPSRVELTITNWDEGTGYIEAVADERVDAASAMGAQMNRAVYS